jgi:hypothetical protein
MKLTCLHCHNEDQEKFTRTKNGSICLICFEKKIEKTPENQKEIAQVELEKFMSRQTGGNNRRFTRGYNAMRNKLSFLENLPDKTPAQISFTSGFKEALSTFENESL